MQRLLIILYFTQIYTLPFYTARPFATERQSHQLSDGCDLCRYVMTLAHLSICMAALQAYLASEKPSNVLGMSVR